VSAREFHQRCRETDRGGIQRQQLVLQVKAYVAGHLVVAGSAGVETLARRPHAGGQPELCGGVDVFVPLVQLEAALGYRREHLAQGRTHAGVLGPGDQTAGAEPLDMTQTSKHIPGQQSRIPGTILGHGVLEHSPVGCAGAPERRGVSHGYRPAR
jgi:hypothetical protein